MGCQIGLTVLVSLISSFSDWGNGLMTLLGMVVGW